MLVLRLLVMVLTIICLMDGHAEVSSSTTGIRDRRESPAVKTNDSEVEILDRKKKKKPKPGKKKKPKPGKKKKPNKKTPVTPTPTVSTSTLKTTTILTTPTVTTTVTTTTTTVSPTTTATTAKTTTSTASATTTLSTTTSATTSATTATVATSSTASTTITTIPTTATTSSTPTTVVTTADSGAGGECKATNGKPCIFPFKDGKEYNECKNEGGKYFWCATSVYDSGKYKHWSYCSTDGPCPLEGDDGECRATNNKPCVFPFKDGNKEYNECADHGGKYFWCATGTNSAGKYTAWSECPKDGSCPLPQKETTPTTTTTTTASTTPSTNDTSAAAIAIANVENALTEINDTLQNLETAGFSEDEKQLLETMNDLSDYMESGSQTRNWNFYDAVKINSLTQQLYSSTANIKASKQVNPGFKSAHQSADATCSIKVKNAKLSKVTAGPGRMFQLHTISKILGIITNAPSSSVCCAECKSLAADSELFEYSSYQKQCDCYKTKLGVPPLTMGSANLDSGVCLDKGSCSISKMNQLKLEQDSGIKKKVHHQLRNSCSPGFQDDIEEYTNVEIIPKTEDFDKCKEACKELSTCFAFQSTIGCKDTCLLYFLYGDKKKDKGQKSCKKIISPYLGVWHVTTQQGKKYLFTFYDKEGYIHLQDSTKSIQTKLQLSQNNEKPFREGWMDSVETFQDVGNYYFKIDIKDDGSKLISNFGEGINAFSGKWLLKIEGNILEITFYTDENGYTKIKNGPDEGNIFGSTDTNFPINEGWMQSENFPVDGHTLFYQIDIQYTHSTIMKIQGNNNGQGWKDECPLNKKSPTPGCICGKMICSKDEKCVLRNKEKLCLDSSKTANARSLFQKATVKNDIFLLNDIWTTIAAYADKIARNRHLNEKTNQFGFLAYHKDDESDVNWLEDQLKSEVNFVQLQDITDHTTGKVVRKWHIEEQILEKIEKIEKNNHGIVFHFYMFTVNSPCSGKDKKILDRWRETCVYRTMFAASKTLKGKLNVGFRQWYIPLLYNRPVLSFDRVGEKKQCSTLTAVDKDHTWHRIPNAALCKEASSDAKVNAPHGYVEAWDGPGDIPGCQYIYENTDGLLGVFFNHSPHSGSNIIEKTNEICVDHKYRTCYEARTDFCFKIEFWKTQTSEIPAIKQGKLRYFSFREDPDCIDDAKWFPPSNTC